MEDELKFDDSRILMLQIVSLKLNNSPDSFNSPTVECGFQSPQRGQMLTAECEFQPLSQKLSGVLVKARCFNLFAKKYSQCISGKFRLS